MGIKHNMSASAQGSKSQRMVKIQEVLILGSLGSLSYFQVSSSLPQNLLCYPLLSTSK